MYKPRFVCAVWTGRKRQTVRMRARCKPGDILSHRTWYGKPYRSPQIHIGWSLCHAVIPVAIDTTGVWWQAGGIPYRLTTDQELAIAVADGFGSVADMLAFFDKEHGLPYSGDMIQWLEINTAARKDTP